MGEERKSALIFCNIERRKEKPCFSLIRKEKKVAREKSLDFLKEN